MLPLKVEYKCGYCGIVEASQGADLVYVHTKLSKTVHFILPSSTKDVISLANIIIACKHHSASHWEELHCVALGGTTLAH